MDAEEQFLTDELAKLREQYVTATVRRGPERRWKGCCSIRQRTQICLLLEWLELRPCRDL